MWYVSILHAKAGIRCSKCVDAMLINQIWTDPLWADDGTGQMPLGNGDVTASVWVSETTGDLRVLLGKSDVFDENSQPVKVGVLRVSFDPPLWSSSAPTPAPIPDPGALTRFHANPGLIGTQSAQFKSPPGFQCSSIDACPQESVSHPSSALTQKDWSVVKVGCVVGAFLMSTSFAGCAVRLNS